MRMIQKVSVNLKFNQNIADEYMAIFRQYGRKVTILRNDMTVGGLAKISRGYHNG